MHIPEDAFPKSQMLDLALSTERGLLFGRLAAKPPRCDLLEPMSWPGHAIELDPGVDPAIQSQDPKDGVCCPGLPSRRAAMTTRGFRIISTRFEVRPEKCEAVFR